MSDGVDNKITTHLRVSYICGHAANAEQGQFILPIN